MRTVAMEQRKKIHPHKFTLWVAIASILMMFAGLTSAYIVKRNQANWLSFELPIAFWYSTAAMIASSITMWQAQRKFKNREIPAYRSLITVTFILGLLFVALQVVGFTILAKNGLPMNKNVAVSFLYVIVGLHGAHVVGGIVALMVTFAKAFSKSVRNYNSVPVDVMATYWHFVDFLWIYLLIFLLAIR
ncbi:MAG: cytochrome c oxidase subunit 3 [Chitinophagaceae bacterium]|nr:cytochrome c oxidase subunit 3 [Chitinophagaceae bacterium]